MSIATAPAARRELIGASGSLFPSRFSDPDVLSARRDQGVNGNTGPKFDRTRIWHLEGLRGLPLDVLEAEMNSGNVRRIFARHINPDKSIGGFVEMGTAFAAETAHVGPRSLVVGKGRVLDNARLEDESMVAHIGTVGGNAVLKGLAVETGEKKKDLGMATVMTNPRVLQGYVGGDAELHGNVLVDSGEVSGNARLTGNVLMIGTNPVVTDDSKLIGGKLIQVRYEISVRGSSLITSSVSQTLLSGKGTITESVIADSKITMGGEEDIVNETVLMKSMVRGMPAPLPKAQSGYRRY